MLNKSSDISGFNLGSELQVIVKTIKFSTQNKKKCFHHLYSQKKKKKKKKQQQKTNEPSETTLYIYDDGEECYTNGEEK